MGWMDPMGLSVKKSIVLLLYFLLVSGYRSSSIHVDHVRVDNEWILDGFDRYQLIDLFSLICHNHPGYYYHQNLNEILGYHLWTN